MTTLFQYNSYKWVQNNVKKLTWTRIKRRNNPQFHQINSIKNLKKMILKMLIYLPLTSTQFLLSFWILFFWDNFFFFNLIFSLFLSLLFFFSYCPIHRLPFLTVFLLNSEYKNFKTYKKQLHCLKEKSTAVRAKPPKKRKGGESKPH